MRTTIETGEEVGGNSAVQERLFAECVETHRGIIIKVARSFTADPVDLDDLVQEILVKLWRSLQHFRGEAKLSTWTYRVALNRALTWKRDESKRRSRQDLHTDLSDRAGSGSAEDSERLNRLYQQIRSLREVDRAMVLLSLDGLSYAEMAEVLGISESNVGARLSRARAKLAASIAEDRS